jgi:ectoine hydroxylase-related dioxygenase (phytanoyl-CoA dioxygenase family)
MHSPCRSLEIKAISISDGERRSSKLSQENLRHALTEFHQNGLVILENAIDHGALDHVRERMLADIPKNLASSHVHFNHGRSSGNITQTPPLLEEYLHEDIWANRFAVTVMEHVIGPCPQLSFATSNIALPGGNGRQAVHSDYYCSHPDFPVFLEACVFLDDVSPQNGSTEIWLGTHRGASKRDHILPDMGWIRRELFVKRARDCPPIQASIPKGSICIRDLRMWHAGMPNFTSDPRIMVGFIYSPKWFGSRMRIKLPEAARIRVESWEHVDCVAEFVEKDFDYLEYTQELNLTQEESDARAQYVPKHGSVTANPENYWSANE